METNYPAHPPKPPKATLDNKDKATIETKAVTRYNTLPLIKFLLIS